MHETPLSEGELLHWLPLDVMNLVSVHIIVDLLVDVDVGGKLDGLSLSIEEVLVDDVKYILEAGKFVGKLAMLIKR